MEGVHDSWTTTCYDGNAALREPVQFMLSNEKDVEEDLALERSPGNRKQTNITKPQCPGQAIRRMQKLSSIVQALGDGKIRNTDMQDPCRSQVFTNHSLAFLRLPPRHPAQPYLALPRLH